MPIATITIKDETRCIISGLDVALRRKLQREFSYEIPGARFTPAVKLGRWNGKRDFFTLAGSTFINMLPDIIPIIDDDGYDIELDDKRTYCRDFTFSEITADSYSHILWPKGHPMAGKPITLHDHQVNAINTFLSNPQGLQCLPTSSGKTIISAILSHKCQSHGRTIIIVPNTDLVKQTFADYVNLGLDVGVYHGKKKDIGKTHTVCTWQSLNSLLKQSKSGTAEITIDEFIEGVVCVMCDEAHGASAEALLNILNGPLVKVPIRWGFTGTIPTDDFAKKSLLVSFGEVVGSLRAVDLQDAGILSRCNINVVQLEDFGEFKTYPDEIKSLLQNDTRNLYIARLIEEVRKSGNTLVLVNRVESGKHLASMIRDAVFVSGDTDTDDRKEQYDSVAESEDKVIVATYGIAAVGLNIVRLHNLVFIEIGKSFVRVIQTIGRGLRKGFDKDHVEVYDVCSTLKFSKKHLTTRKKYYKEAGYPFSVAKTKWQ